MNFSQGQYAPVYKGCLYPPYRLEEIQKILEPLIFQLKKYDGLRVYLETRGGKINHLKQLNSILCQDLSIKGAFRPHKMALVDPESIHTLLRDLGGTLDVRLDVRILETRMPVYYLCRIRRDFWSAYSLIVEDLYRSPGFPLADERLVRLMEGGHEVYYLRLSQFREKLKTRSPSLSSRELDETLYNLGRHIFQAAWHEDQRVGLAVARHFNLPAFAQAIELLYLCLSGELCELRSAIDETMLHFFQEAYPQPAIHGLLIRLPALEGRALTDLPPRALKRYLRLSAAFNRFLRCQVPWGNQKTQVPLYKLIFGNFFRLEIVKKNLNDDKKVKVAGSRLEKEAVKIISELLDMDVRI